MGPEENEAMAKRQSKPLKKTSRKLVRMRKQCALVSLCLSLSLSLSLIEAISDNAMVDKIAKTLLSDSPIWIQSMLTHQKIFTQLLLAKL